MGSAIMGAAATTVPLAEINQMSYEADGTSPGTAASAIDEWTCGSAQSSAFLLYRRFLQVLMMTRPVKVGAFKLSRSHLFQAKCRSSSFFGPDVK